MTICLVTHCYPLRAGELFGNFLPDFVSALRGEGTRVLVLAPEMQGPLPRVSDASVRTFRWRGGGRRLGELKPWRPWDLVSALSLFRRGKEALVDLTAREKVEFCLACWAIPGGVITREAWTKTGVPYAVWTLGSDIHLYGRKPILKGMAMKALKDATNLFANSRALVQEVSSLTGRCVGFMPTNRLLPKTGIPGLTLGTGRRHLLFVGRLEHVKGVDLLLEAMSSLLVEGLDVDLQVLGEGSLRRDLERLVSSRGIATRVFFRGVGDALTVAAYLKASDLLVIPSRGEGLPVVFHEAMQMGLPVAGTDVGDLGDVIREYGVGAVAQSLSPVGIAGAIRQALRLERSSIAQKADSAWRAFDIHRAASTFLGEIQGPESRR